VRTRNWTDHVGWLLEKGIIWIFCSAFVVLFLGNQILIYINNDYGLRSVEEYLYNAYDTIIAPNIGTITTIASIFVGIYITVLSVLGSLKANSIIALLSDSNLKKIIKFISYGLLSSFAVVFYSFIAVIIPNQFFRAFFFFLLIIYMLLTSFRFGINLSLIYSFDLGKLSENIKNEKANAEKNEQIMARLERYLNDREAERIRKG